MKKRTNKFATLSPEDRQFVHELCEQYTYDEAVEILARPRPEGLSIETSISSLCRFNTRYHPEARQTGVTAQFCRAVSTRHQAEGFANTQAILALTQNRLIDALRSGKALADLTSEYRLFFQSHKAWLAENQWRSTLTEEQLNQSWDAFADNVVSSSEVDFTWTDIHDPVWDQMNRLEMEELQDEPYDAEIERAHKYPTQPKKPKITEQLLPLIVDMLRQSGQALSKDPAATQPLSEPDEQESAPSDSAKLQNVPSKKPEIAQIPPNCSSPGTAKNQKPNIPLL